MILQIKLSVYYLIRNTLPERTTWTVSTGFDKFTYEGECRVLVAGALGLGVVSCVLLLDIRGSLVM